MVKALSLCLSLSFRDNWDLKIGTDLFSFLFSCLGIHRGLWHGNDGSMERNGYDSRTEASNIQKAFSANRTFRDHIDRQFHCSGVRQYTSTVLKLF